MAAPIGSVFRSFGSNLFKIHFSFSPVVTQGRILFCNKCSSRCLLVLRHFKVIRYNEFSKNIAFNSPPQTILCRGGNSGWKLSSHGALCNNYMCRLYAGTYLRTWVFSRNKLEFGFNDHSRSFCYVSHLLCGKRDHVQSGEKIKPSTQDDTLDHTDRDPKENIKTIPNILTLGRILCTPVIGYLVVEQSFTWSLGLFVCAGITDMLDGVIARNMKNQMSALGTALDPLADKILITVLTVTLTTAGLLPVPLAVLIIGRDVLLVAAGFYLRFISLPPPRTLSRYFDVTNPTAKLMPSTLSKINTILQLVLVSFTLAAPVFNFIDHPALQALWYITGATTFCSGVGYVWSRNNYVKFLRKGMERKF